MALVSITEAANLARKNQADLYRDIDDGRVQATRSPDGELLLDAEELKRIYPPKASEEDRASLEQVKIAVLEERTRSLERALALEAELRKVKDQVANELRARLADKDNVIKVLESKLLYLEDAKEIPTLSVDEDDEESAEHGKSEQPESEVKSGSGWWSRLLKPRPGSSLQK